MYTIQNRADEFQPARPVTKIINYQVEGGTSRPQPTPIVGVASATPSQPSAPIGMSVADASSGGSGVSGISDLFGGIGNFFSDLTHPGTGATTPSSAPSSAQPNSLLLIGAAVGAFFLFRR